MSEGLLLVEHWMGLGPLDNIARLLTYILLQDFHLLKVTAKVIAIGGMFLCVVVESFPVTVSSRFVPESLGKRFPFFE
jgi:hypothetical protein